MRVTIRRTLLLAFLALGLAPMVLASTLAFLSLQSTMHDDIRRELRQQAGAITASVDKLLFERLQNAATWARQDIMQDVQVGDVDRRIAIFLARLQQGYGGVYRALLVVDNAGKVVASSATRPASDEVPAYRTWQHLPAGDLDVSLSYPLETGDGETLALAVPLLSLAEQKPIGKLVLELDWRHFEEMLDREEIAGRMIAIVDDARIPFAASRSLRSHTAASRQELYSGLDLHATDETVSREVAALGMRALIAVGEAPPAPGSVRTGLHAIVIESEQAAFQPERDLAWAYLSIVVLLVIVIVLVANRISATVARPVAALTAFSRAYRLGRPAPLEPFSSGGEIAELREAFGKMVDDVEEARKKLIGAAKLAAVGEMASAIVHEIRTPLGIMRSSAQVLKRETKLTPEARELIAFVESETERLNRLVSTLLDNARPKPPAFARADLHALLHRVAAMLQPQLDAKAVALHEEFHAEGPFLACDAEQITQVALNLVQNALQAAPRGGHIVVSTTDSADMLQLTVDDDGPGIADADKLHVFEVFFSKREGGVGLGLAIVQQIVNAHGGSIGVGDSQQGGARFTVTLPRAPQLPAMETL